MHELDATDRQLLAAYRDAADPPAGAMDRVFEEVLERVQPVVLPVPWCKSVAMSFAIAAGMLLALRGVVAGTQSAKQTATPTQMQAPMAGDADPAAGEVTPKFAKPEPTERTAKQVATPPAEAAEVEAAPAPSPRPASATKAKAKAAPASADDLAAELELLAAAKRAEDPTERLKLLKEHATKYGRSRLAEERAVLTIETMCTLGQGEGARQRAKAFGERFPKSAFAGRISRSCAEAG